QRRSRDAGSAAAARGDWHRRGSRADLDRVGRVSVLLRLPLFDGNDGVGAGGAGTGSGWIRGWVARRAVRGHMNGRRGHDSTVPALTSGKWRDLPELHASSPVTSSYGAPAMEGVTPAHSVR